MPRRRASRLPFDFTLDRHTAHGIATVAIFAIAALLLLSLFDMAGRMGARVDAAMANGFGWQRIVLPFVLIAIGIHEISPQRLPLKVTNYIGFALFFFSLNPLVHTVGSRANGVVPPLVTLGGKLGAMLSDPMVNLFGRAGATITFAALFIVSLLLIFNTSLRRVIEWLFQTWKYVARILRIGTAPFRWALSRYRDHAREMQRRALSMAQEPLAVLPPEDSTFASVAVREEEEEPEEEASADAQRPRTPVVHLKQKKRRPNVEVPIELLTKRDQKPTAGDVQRNQQIIQRTLETFGILVEMGDVSIGPTVTQFTLRPSEGIKLVKITGLHNDLALALAAHPIRIEAPIPGKSLVGVEVPNQSVATVGMREMLESREWRERTHAMSMPFALGRDVAGKPWIADLARMPHLLVAGATGSGKSVCLNSLITSFMYGYGPDDLKFILVDPKRVELPVYNGIPHLLTPVITDMDKTVNALKWSLREMDRRFDVLASFGARDLASYNARSEEKLPTIVFVIDELADLIVTAMQEVEGPIVRLAQMSRAVGIHLVLATQRPSVDVITGLIKANIPARIAFAVASSMDSRTILDQIGAEKLLGRGDMLFQTAEMSTPKRLQGAYISDDEIRRVVEFLKSTYEPAEYDPSVVEQSARGNTAFRYGIDEGDSSDDLLPEAKEEILRAGKASASLLQRRLKVGYARAARMLDLLEQQGFIGPADGAKPREILNVEFTKQLEQVPLPIAHPALDQVNREMPALDEESM